MMKQFTPIILAGLLLSGCETLVLPPAASQPAAQPEAQPAAQPVATPQTNEEVLQALSQLEEIKLELKQLRNAVEELQFESENGARRQQELYLDLDRRLGDLQRSQRVQTLQDAGVDPKVDDAVTIIASQEEVDATATEEVAVINPDPESGSTSDTTDTTNGTDTAESGAADSTEDIEAASADAVTLEEQNAYEEAFEMLKQSRYEDAVAGFQEMIDTWPESQLADDAYFWMSEARYVNREFEYALSGFRTVVSKFPESQRVPEALLKVGYIQYDIGDYENAAVTFRDILDRFPGHQVTVSAQTRLRRIEQTIQ